MTDVSLYIFFGCHTAKVEVLSFAGKNKEMKTIILWGFSKTVLFKFTIPVPILQDFGFTPSQVQKFMLYRYTGPCSSSSNVIVLFNPRVVECFRSYFSQKANMSSQGLFPKNGTRMTVHEIHIKVRQIYVWLFSLMN